MTNAADQKAFREALGGGRLETVYYLHGDEEHLKRDALNELLRSAVDPATRAFNLDQRKGADLDAGALGSILATPPMMASRRVMVIQDVETLRKDARATLDRYIAHPSSDAVLVLVAGPGAKPDKPLMATARAVEFAPLTGAQLPKWIEREARRAGASIAKEAGALLQDIVGSDLSQLALEIEKLASYTTGEQITEDAVSAVVGVRREETMGHLLDAVGQRDSVTALAVLPLVLQQPKNSAVTLVMALTVQMLAIAWGKSTRFAPPRLAREFFPLLKEAGGVFTGRTWSEAVSSWTNAVPQWTLPDLDQALSALAEADAELKQTRLSSDEQLMTTLLLRLCGAPMSEKAA